MTALCIPPLKARGELWHHLQNAFHPELPPLLIRFVGMEWLPEGWEAGTGIGPAYLHDIGWRWIAVAKPPEGA